MQLIYKVSDKPKFGQLIVFAIQQLLAIMAATLVVPVIVGNGMEPAAALFGAGVGTLIYVLCTQRKSPVFLGSSFAFLGSMAAAFAGGVSMQLGYVGLILGAVFAGLVYVVIALIVKFAGVAWINKLMPAVVIGPTVAIIGLSLAGNAVGDISSSNYTKVLDVNDYHIVQEAYVDGDETNANNSYVVLNDDNTVNESVTVTADDKGDLTATTKPASPLLALLCGLVTLFTVVLCSTYGKKTAKLIPFILGILAGYAVAAIFTIIGNAADIDAMKIVNFSPILDLFRNESGECAVSLSTFFRVPSFTFMTAKDGLGELNGTYVSTIALAYIPVAFVVFAEHIADHKNISTIIETDLLENPGLHRTLLGDGIGSMVGAFFGGCPNTTYGESIGCVAITRNASVYTIIAAAIGAIIIAFLSPFVAFVNSIPSCVMGGVCMTLYGFIAVSGLKMLQTVNLEENKNLFVASVILIAGIGGLTLNFGKITITSIAAALILGIIVNVVLSKAKTEEKAD